MLYITQTASGSPSVEASMAATWPWVIPGIFERSGVSKGSLFWLDITLPKPGEGQTIAPEPIRSPVSSAGRDRSIRSRRSPARPKPPRGPLP